MKQKIYVPCLTIAGSDPSGGAGLQADLKTFAAMGCYGQAVVSALTVQNSQGVRASFPVEAEWVKAQIEAVVNDFPPRAVKIGMLGSMAAVVAVADCVGNLPVGCFVVVDPVMVSSSGYSLMNDDCLLMLRHRLIPACSLVTPNLAETAVLLGEVVADAEEAACRLFQQLGGKTAVLVKGGHAEGLPVDVLCCEHGVTHSYSAPRVATCNDHGTGCTFSSAIAARCALGDTLPEAVANAKFYLSRALESGANIFAGKGHGAMNHFFAPKAAAIEEK